MIVVFGIPNCDTVKKARAWLSSQGVEHEFHDFKKHGLDGQQLAQWAQTVGWQKLLNRQGSTWRKLDAALQASVVDSASARALMLAHASVIKRPVLVQGQTVIVGVNPEAWAGVVV